MVAFIRVILALFAGLGGTPHHHAQRPRARAAPAPAAVVVRLQVPPPSKSGQRVHLCVVPPPGGPRSSC